MLKRVTESDVSLGYSSDPDDPAEDEPEEKAKNVQKAPVEANPSEIYVGNTGEAAFRKLYQTFRSVGTIKDMFCWRSHGHLYHARITYRDRSQANAAVNKLNQQMFLYRRLRVSLAAERAKLNFATALRIDGLGPDVTEEQIYYHFRRSCGEICFVIKTATAAYIQFPNSKAFAIAKAMGLKMILKGHPYTLSRISADDKIDHIQELENMKAIRLRKPFVMVENYPKLPEGTPLCQYKSKFESFGTKVRHFKIQPKDDETVQLALCMDTQKERDLVIERLNGTTIDDKQLKLYMKRRGKVRMDSDSVEQYVVAPNTIMVENILPYYTDYEVFLLFRKCGPISFLEKFDTTWTICFDGPRAVILARAFVFSLFDMKLTVKEWNSQSLYIEKLKKSKRQNTAIKTEPEQNDEPENIQAASLGAPTKQQAVVDQAKQIDELFKALGNPADDVKATPVVVVKSEPSTSQPAKKRPAEDCKSAEQPSYDPPPKSYHQEVPLAVVAELDRDSPLFLGQISNLPKGIAESDVREMLHEHEVFQVFLYCSQDLYHPTSIAYVRFVSKLDARGAIRSHHHGTYRAKRLRAYHAVNLPAVKFTPDRSVMLKNLPKDVTEEGIVQELEALKLEVEDVTRPAYHYAYVGFTAEFKIHDKLLTRLRNALMPFEIEVLPLYQSVPKTWMHFRSFDITSVLKVCYSFGLGKEEAPGTTGQFGVHNAHKLFVGNIPRDTQADDVVDYFNNFGSVTDYVPIVHKSCHLRKSVILSFVNRRHAQNAFRQQPHVLEGSTLDLHLMESPPGQFFSHSQTKHITVKSHSRFLTNDEIRNALESRVTVWYQLRFDAFDNRAHFVAAYKAPKEFDEESFCLMKYINDEAVKIVLGYDPTPLMAHEAREKVNISSSRYRQQKEQYLMSVVYKENLKNSMEVRWKPNRETDIAFESFYDSNSVQINNVSPDTSVESLRDLFNKCGDIVGYRALLLAEDDTKICYVKFNTDLAADLACTYSQRMVDGKRILVHLAKEALVVEHDRAILVERLNPTTTTEQLHDAFSTVGIVKYVQKQCPFSAIVCFTDKDCMMRAANVTKIPYSGSFTILPCYQVYNSRFLKKFSCQEEIIPIERMQAALKPRILPEFHQLKVERHVELFEDLPDTIQSQLITELSLTREQIPDFDNLCKSEQIDALKTKYDGSQKENFLRLKPGEQAKLLLMTNKRQKTKTEVIDLVDDDLPPAPKQTRLEEPADNKNSNQPLSILGIPPDQRVAWMCRNASHVPQALPASGLLGSLGNTGPPLQMGPPLSSNMFPQEDMLVASQRFPALYSLQTPRQFIRAAMPQIAIGPNPRFMMRPEPVPIVLGSPMGRIALTGAAPPDYRRIQQWKASMAYNVGP